LATLETLYARAERQDGKKKAHAYTQKKTRATRKSERRERRLKEHAACAYFAPVKHAPTAIDPSGNTVGMAMCMYLNSGSVLNARLLSRVSEGSARPFTAQAYSILSFVGVNAYLCDANDDDDDDDDALVMMMSSFPIIIQSSTTIATDARPIATDAMRSSTKKSPPPPPPRLLLPPPNTTGGIVVSIKVGNVLRASKSHKYRLEYVV